MPTYSSIHRVGGMTEPEFRQAYQAANTPVVITGGVRDWKATSIWNHAWFNQNYGAISVPISFGPRLSSTIREMPLAEYLDLIASDGVNHNNAYLRQFPVLERFPNISKYFEPPIYCQPKRHLMISLWLGPKGTVQPLHKDNHDQSARLQIMMAQIMGRKRVVLAGGDQDHLMYKRPNDATDYHHSQIDLENPDFDKFPLFKQAHLWETVLEEGDLLFIPADTWHFVRSLEKSITLSFWWNPNPIVDLIRRLLLTRSEAEAADLIKQDLDLASVEDMDELGGIKNLIRGMNTLPAPLQLYFLSRCSTELRTAVNNYRLVYNLPALVPTSPPATKQI